MQNHVIDPTFFYDVIEEFAFDYDWYATSGYTVDDLGKRVTQYKKLKIRGSLQSQGSSQRQALTMNSEQMNYEFYCKSLYRIHINDFILYKNRWLRVNSVHDFDEYGVRHVSLTMVDLNNYRDLAEYVKYLNGSLIV